MSEYTGGFQVDGDSLRPSISADGRYVAFDSDAWNLVWGDTNDVFDVFVHDRQTGVHDSGERRRLGQPVRRRELPAVAERRRPLRRVLLRAPRTSSPGTRTVLPTSFLFDRRSGATKRVSVAGGGGEANAEQRAARAERRTGGS